MNSNKNISLDEVLNNGTKQSRIDAGLDADGYCDMGTIADWKMDMMVWHLLKQLRFSIRSIVDKSYALYEKCYKSSQHLSKGELEELNGRLEKEKNKRDNLTEMRLGGELSKEEYQTNKHKINSNILKLKQRIDELQRQSRAESKKLLQKISFIIDSLINKVVPNSGYDYNWYMNLIPHLSDDEYQCIKEFNIEYEDAKAYRKLRGEMLRPNQWRNLVVQNIYLVV